jgi:hypothetical protein
MYKLKLTLPNLAEDATVAIAGLGELKNGKEYTIDEKAALAFREAHAAVESSEYDKNGRRSHTKVLGPPLEEAFKYTKGITVIKAASGGGTK